MKLLLDRLEPYLDRFMSILECDEPERVSPLFTFYNSGTTTVLPMNKIESVYDIRDGRVEIMCDGCRYVIFDVPYVEVLKQLLRIAGMHDVEFGEYPK